MSKKRGMPLHEKGLCPKCSYRLAELFQQDRDVHHHVRCPECGHEMEQGVMFTSLRPTERALENHFSDLPWFVRIGLLIMGPILLIFVGLAGVFAWWWISQP